MSEDRKEMVPVHYPERVEGEVIDLRYNDQDLERYEKRMDKIVDTIHSVVTTEKTSAAIAKKEADTAAHATTTHVDLEKEYVESLLKEKKNKDLTPQEVAEIDDRIEASLLRTQESEREARRTAEDSPHRQKINWPKVLFVVSLAGLGGLGGWRLYRAFA